MPLVEVSYSIYWPPCIIHGLMPSSDAKQGLLQQLIRSAAGGSSGGQSSAEDGSNWVLAGERRQEGVQVGLPGASHKGTLSCNTRDGRLQLFQGCGQLSLQRSTTLQSQICFNVHSSWPEPQRT